MDITNSIDSGRIEGLIPPSTCNSAWTRLLMFGGFSHKEYMYD